MRLFPEVKGMSYEERLMEVNLTTMEDRRTREDNKILWGIDRVDRDRLLERQETETQGPSWKLDADKSLGCQEVFLQSWGGQIVK